MAIHIVNDLLAGGDFIRLTRTYSSAQSLSRAHRKGLQPLLSIGKLRFAQCSSQHVANLYGVSSWQDIAVNNKVPEGLSPLSRISKKIGVGESAMLAWAALNRMEVYLIGGYFAARLNEAKAIADGEQKRKATHTKPPKKRHRRKYT